MNDINAILRKIDEDAKESAAAILKAGEESRDKILADYRAQAEKERQAILDSAKAQCEAMALRAASQAGIEERNKKLQTRRAAIDAAFAGAMKKLCGLSDEQKVALFTHLAAENITGDAELILNPADRASIGTALVAAIEKKLAAQSGRSPLAGAAVAVVEKNAWCPGRGSPCDLVQGDRLLCRRLPPSGGKCRDQLHLRGAGFRRERGTGAGGFQNSV